MNSIQSDLYRFNGKIGLKSFFKGLKKPGFKYMLFWRMAKQHKRYTFLGTLARLMVRHYSFKYGYQIPYTVSLGHGLFMPHFGNIVINGKSKIGDNCNISQGVTIGNEKRGIRQGAPTIGDRVYLGPNSVVVGKVNIGSNVLIAPNAYVNFDVDNDSIVIGNPAKVIKRNGAIKGYINNEVQITDRQHDK
jgi:serine O-acetyltransferase